MESGEHPLVTHEHEGKAHSASASCKARARSFFLLASWFSFSASCVVGMPANRRSAQGLRSRTEISYQIPNIAADPRQLRKSAEVSSRIARKGHDRVRTGLLHTMATDCLQAPLACGGTLLEVGGGGRLSSVVARILRAGSVEVLS